MEFKLLENIIAIAEEGNLSRAAKRLFVSQPALSQQLSKLESQLGTPLFFRGKNGLSLTQAGEIYIDGALKMLAIRDEMYNHIYDIASSKNGSLSVGVAPGRSPMIVSSIYPQFRKKFPAFKVQILDYNCIQAEEMLTQGKIDLGFSLLTDSEISSKLPISYASLIHEEIYLVTSKNHPVASRYYQGSRCPIIDLSLFKNESFALTTKDSKLRHFVDELFAFYSINPPVHYEVYNVEAIMTVVAKSNLVTLIPSGFLPKSQNLIHFRLNPKRFMDFAICWNSNHYITTAEQHFISLCQNFYQQCLLNDADW